MLAPLEEPSREVLGDLPRGQVARAKLPTKNRVILVANDTPDSLSAIAASLTDEGYTPLTACDGQEVLRELQRQAVDLVALDVSMPTMDGVVTCREMRSHPDFSRLPVIIYGDLEDANRREEAFRAGCNVYVSLTDPDGLLGPIEDLLGEAAEPVFLDELAKPTEIGRASCRERV